MNINRVFRFDDEDGNPVSINDIDRVACKVWDIEYNDRHYARPEGRHSNWYDVIGGAITDSSHKDLSWDKVIGLIIAGRIFLGTRTTRHISNELLNAQEYAQPYMDLVWKLEDIGIQPKCFDKRRLS